MTGTVLGPVYIGGPDRCGKTLVAALLGSHSRLAIPIVGSNLWTFFHDQYGDLAADGNLDAVLAALGRYKHARFLGLDEARLRAELRAGPRTYARLFALIHEHFAERAGKPRWGDQTGLVERYADEIFAAYPGVRMIHMIRDPRDRYEASIRMWPNARGRVGAAVARWRYSVDLGERNVARWPEGYRILRYEDVVRDPVGTVRELCAFIGEAFEPAMLQLADAPTYRAKLLAGSSDGTLITADHIGDYHGRLSTDELAFLQSQLGTRMRRHGYELDLVPMSGAQRARYWLLAWPSHAARMAVWSALEGLQHRLPGVIGRRPSAHKVVDSTHHKPAANG